MFGIQPNTDMKHICVINETERKSLEAFEIWCCSTCKG